MATYLLFQTCIFCFKILFCIIINNLKSNFYLLAFILEMGNEQMCCPQKIMEGGEMINSIKPVRYTSKIRTIQQGTSTHQQQISTHQFHRQTNNMSSVVETKTKNQQIKIQNNSQIPYISNIQNERESQRMSQQSSHLQKLQREKEAQKIIIPQLSQEIKTVLKKLKPFQKQLDQRLTRNIRVKKFKDDVYQGEIDAFGRPQGYGRLYKSNGNFLIVEFINGIVQNVGIAIMKNGSYYLGSFKNNQAHDSHGQYFCEQFQYQGGFDNNKLNGQGTQIGSNYSFHGDYRDNMKIKGTYAWGVNNKSNLRERNDKKIQFNYQYSGKFDKDQLFTGEGVLRQPKGQYKGQFFRGKKHGKGQYLYKSKLRYQGEYNQNFKQGLGILTNYDQSIAYKGEWKKGLPHGYGFLFNQKGTQIPSTFIEGLSTQILPFSQTQKLNQALERAGF